MNDTERDEKNNMIKMEDGGESKPPNLFFLDRQKGGMTKIREEKLSFLGHSPSQGPRYVKEI